MRTPLFLGKALFDLSEPACCLTLVYSAVAAKVLCGCIPFLCFLVAVMATKTRHFIIPHKDLRSRDPLRLRPPVVEIRKSQLDDILEALLGNMNTAQDHHHHLHRCFTARKQNCRATC